MKIKGKLLDTLILETKEDEATAIPKGYIVEVIVQEEDQISF